MELGLDSDQQLDLVPVHRACSLLFKQLQKEKDLYDFYLHGTRLGMSPDPLNDWAKAT